MLPKSNLLDRRIPLRNASFHDVIGLEIDIPMRYAECVAILRDGRRTGLKDCRQLLGWSGPESRRNFYFYSGNGEVVRLRTNTRRRRAIRSVEFWDDVTLCRAQSASDPRIRSLGTGVHRIIAVDGSLCFAQPKPWPERSAYSPSLPAESMPAGAFAEPA